MGKKLSKSIMICSFLYSFALAISFVLGIQLKHLGYTWSGVRGKLSIIAVSLLASVFIVPFIYFIICLIGKSKYKFEKKEIVVKEKYKVFLICFLSIFLLWIPRFLAFYPAIMSYDFNTQYISARTGLSSFTTHHPLIHTFLIRQFLLLGDLIGSPEIGMALFSLTQMMILSAIMAYSCVMMANLTRSKIWSYISALFFSLFPVHSILSVCITKDILFSAFFLLFVTFLIRISFSNGKEKKSILLFSILAGVMTMLFRNNALYAFIVFTPIWVVLSTQKRIRNLFVSIAIIVLSIGILFSSKVFFRAESGSKIEMYSVMLQTFARTGLNHSDILTEKEFAIIDYYVPQEVWSSYNPGISDNVKSCTVTEFYKWENNKIDLLKDWIYIGLHYPNDYIDAFLALTCGYWSILDESHANVWGNGSSMGTGLISTFNASTTDKYEKIENKSFIPWLEKMDRKLVNDNTYLSIPIVSILFKPAFYCWILFFIFVSSLFLKKKKVFIVTLWPTIYLMTMYLGPVVNYRYVYPILISLPLLLAFLFSDRVKDKASIVTNLDSVE